MTRTVKTPAIDRYRARTPGSQALFAEASMVVSGGVSRRTLAFEPYPFYVAGAQGAWLTDVDGNRYLDLVNNFTSLPHGHAHGPTVEAAIAQLRDSPAPGAAHHLEGAYAAELRERLPLLERLHFTTTGSEAVAFAVRLARAHTGRVRLLKFEGAFHGTYPDVAQDVANLPALAPGSSAPARPASAGLEPTTTITAVYNDPASVRDAFARWGHEIAAVIVEPFLGNSALIRAERPFLDQVFESAGAAGSLVVFDEIQSLRVDHGGAHGAWGYAPDLLTLGKIVGGGFPLAVYGGRRELFDVLEGPEPRVTQTGTFTATPVSLAAGRAALSCFGPAEYAVLEDRTERVRRTIRQECARAGIPVHVNGLGSLFNICTTDQPVTSYRAFRAADMTLLNALRTELLLRGVVIMPRGSGCLSTAVDDDDVAHVLEALSGSIRAIKES